MEFLLINHPLDCPICDKSGECDLQDNSFQYGQNFSSYTEDRRTYLDLDMGPVIQKNMNRCIHCTRCIRFGDEIAGIREMVAIERGNNTEITTIDGNPLETAYAGNYADICPTGSLTLKDFRFKKRVWFIKKTATICEGCSRGCSMWIHHEGNHIFRCTPKENLQVNKYWICDEGRFNFQYIKSQDRITSPYSKNKNQNLDSNWIRVIAEAKTISQGRTPLILIGSDLTQEEATTILMFQKQSFPEAVVQHFGTKEVFYTSQDFDEDKILKRVSKTANLHGLEKLGIPPFLDNFSEKDTLIFVFRAGRAQLPNWQGRVVIGFGVFSEQEAGSIEFVLPGPAFAEKNGTIINSQNKEQSFSRAIAPPEDVKTLGEILMLWKNSQANSTIGDA